MSLAQSDPFTTADAITLGIASIGAFTGIAALGITISQFWLSGARLRVKITAGWLGADRRVAHNVKTWDPVDARMVGRPATRILAVTAVNRGRMATTINAWGVIIGKRMEDTAPRMPPNPKLPVRIEPGESETFVIQLEDVITAHYAAPVAMGRRTGKVRGRIRLGDGRALRSRRSLTIPTD